VTLGSEAAAAIEAGALGGRSFDDAFRAPPAGEPFVLARRGVAMVAPGESFTASFSIAIVRP
jgi:hypothetical protein